jgi:hypothetical protein
MLESQNDYVIEVLLNAKYDFEVTHSAVLWDA